MDVERQTGEVIVNVEYHGPIPRDHLATGVALLRHGHYLAARRELARAVDAAPGDQRGHYYLALALLDGHRPNRCSRAVIERVRRHLDTAAELPEAKALLLMVDEDYELRWRQHTLITQTLIDLVGRVDRDHAGELLAHVPARGHADPSTVGDGDDRP